MDWREIRQDGVPLCGGGEDQRLHVVRVDIRAVEAHVQLILDAQSVCGGGSLRCGRQCQQVRGVCQLTEPLGYPFLHLLIAGADDSSAVWIGAYPAGPAMGLGVPRDSASAYRAHGFLPNRIQRSGAGSVVSFVLPLDLRREELLIADEPGIDVCPQILPILQNPLDHVLVPLAGMLVVGDVSSAHLLRDPAEGGPRQVAGEDVLNRVSFRGAGDDLSAPHHIAEGGLSLPCHYRTAFPIRSVSSRPLSRVNFRVSAETITIRLTSDSNSS